MHQAPSSSPTSRLWQYVSSLQKQERATVLPAASAFFNFARYARAAGSPISSRKASLYWGHLAGHSPLCFHARYCVKTSGEGASSGAQVQPGATRGDRVICSLRSASTG